MKGDEEGEERRGARALSLSRSPLDYGRQAALWENVAFGSSYNLLRLLRLKQNILGGLTKVDTPCPRRVLFLRFPRAA